MESLLVVLSLFVVISLAAMAFIYAKLQLQIESMDSLKSRAADSVQASEDMAKKIVEAHNGLSKKIIDVAGELESIKTKIEFSKARM